MRTSSRIAKETNKWTIIKQHLLSIPINKNKLSQACRRIQNKTLKLQYSNKIKLQNANATRSTKTIQEHNKNRDRHKIHKTRQVLTKPNKTSDMNNRLHESTNIKTITGKTNRHLNEKDTAKTNSTNITLDVKPQHNDINAYSLVTTQQQKANGQKQTNTLTD